MHAWLCENPVGVDALTWKEIPSPSPKAGEVLIEIKAASLNFPDLLIVQNKYQIKPPFPFSPAAEVAGVIESVGAGRLRHPYLGTCCAVHAIAKWVPCSGCRRFHHDLCNVTSCIN